MKKLLSFALVLLTALSFCVPVCAADNSGVLIATDFKDRKAHFVPLDLNLASANIVTVDGNECLYIATRNTGANNWLGFPVRRPSKKRPTMFLRLTWQFLSFPTEQRPDR